MSLDVKLPMLESYGDTGDSFSQCEWTQQSFAPQLESILFGVHCILACYALTHTKSVTVDAEEGPADCLKSPTANQHHSCPFQTG